jgi:hypothetical protein
MVVWGDVIFQPRPDLSDTHSVTVRLQCRDDQFYSSARQVPIRIISSLISTKLKLAPL